ncbi:MAG: glycine cleavage system aminomethyltransferase GcvT [Ignavibacteriae bacterium]|nr:glycine cleavage system aminomethyltransferase GcvT [Ignavibacteriota bacterium]
MKLTPFHEKHIGLGAKMVEFAGFHMPIQYEGIIAEHKRVRTTVGVFDVTHMGEFEVRGKDAFAFVQRMTTNDVSRLEEGKVQYSALCYDNAGIVDDLLVYHCGDYVQLVVNASNMEKDFAWLSEHVSGDVQLIDKSDDTALLAIQGPKSLDTMRVLTDLDLASMPYYSFLRGTVAGIECLISRTGYTGELGFEVYFKNDPVLASKMWDAIFEAGKPYDIAAIGLGARDTLRLEVGFCLYGNDIDQTTHPLEAGLGWITKLAKGDFIGRDVLLKAKEAGMPRKLVGLLVEGRSVPRHGYDVIVDGTPAGVITSGTMSPMLEKGIAMGYVPSTCAEPGSTVHVRIRNQDVPAKVVKIPFIQKNS